MRLRAVLVAILLAAGLSAPAAATGIGKKAPRRLGVGWAAKRAVKKSPPPVIVVRSRAQSAGMSCRSTAKG